MQLASPFKEVRIIPMPPVVVNALMQVFFY
jgi:hypothetical protein